MKAVYLIAPLGLALSLAYALDQNADGISDVYAAHYGLSPGSGFDDPDGDGLSNAEESAWGTDPFDKDSKQTAAYGMVGSLYDFSVPTLIGKRYQFQGSSDLLTTWMDIDIPFEGTGDSEHLLTTMPIAGTDKFFWRIKALPEPDDDNDGLGAFEESLLGTSDNLKDSDGDQVSDLVEFLEGLNPASNTDTDGDGLSDDWEVFSGTDPNDDGSVDPDNGPDGDINGDGTSNRDAYNGGVNGSTTIGPVNLEVGSSLSGGIALSFKPEHSSSGFGYPADRYDAASVDGWEAVIGDYIEIWDEDDEGVFDTFIELQSHWDADGIKQEFEMMPNSQLTFILAYKGRYDDYDFGGNTQNAFSLKVEGASEVLVNEAVAQPDGNALSHSFMADDNPEADPLPYENWSFASVTIIAGPEATNNDGSVDLTLSLLPDELTDDYGAEVTYGGFVQLLKMDMEEVWSNQFSGIEVNKLPGQSGHQGRPYLTSGGEEYLIVGPKSGTNTISLKVKFDAPDTPGLQDKIKFKILPSSSPVDAYHASPTTTSIDWSTKIATVEYELNILDENLYEGYETELSLLMYLDLDGNDQIDSPSDVAVNSDFSNGDTFHLKFVFSNNYLNAAILGYFGGVFGGLNDWPDAANMLNAFATGNVPNGAVDLNTTITTSGDRPSHNNGVVFDNSGSGPSSNYVFDALSDMSERVLDSADVTRHVRDVLDSNYDAVVAAFAQPGNENETFLVLSFPISSFDERIGFFIDGNLHRTFGTANISGTVEAVVNKLAGSGGNVYQVDVVSVDANVTDLYDWDYDKGGNYDKPFALMQGGFDTIAPGGQIFKLRTRLDGHISDFQHFINPIED